MPLTMDSVGIASVPFIFAEPIIAQSQKRRHNQKRPLRQRRRKPVRGVRRRDGGRMDAGGEAEGACRTRLRAFPAAVTPVSEYSAAPAHENRPRWLKDDEVFYHGTEM